MELRYVFPCKIHEFSQLCSFEPSRVCLHMYDFRILPHCTEVQTLFSLSLSLSLSLYLSCSLSHSLSAWFVFSRALQRPKDRLRCPERSSCEVSSNNAGLGSAGAPKRCNPPPLAQAGARRAGLRWITLSLRPWHLPTPAASFLLHVSKVFHTRPELEY